MKRPEVVRNVGGLLLRLWEQASPADIPAHVHDYSSPTRGRCAAVTHPSGDEYHENAIATRTRLRARGYTIVPYEGLTPQRLPPL